MPKTRSDALWGNLPAEEQDELYSWLTQPPRLHLAAALKRARQKFGIRGGSVASLSSWLSSESLRRAVSGYRTAANAADKLRPLFRSVGANIPKATVERIQQRAFEVALATGDVKELKILGKLVLDFAKLEAKEKELKLAREKFELQAEAMRKAKEKLEKVRDKGGLSKTALAQIEEAAKLL